MLKASLEFIMNGGEVERFHSVRTLQRETVAEHSFGVALVCWLLKGELASKQLLLAALTHDLAEQDVGDIPAPTKRQLGAENAISAMELRILREYGMAFDDLTIEDRRTLKIADIFDGMLFCIRERQLGNRRIGIIFMRYNSYLESYGLRGVEAELHEHILSLWGDADGC